MNVLVRGRGKLSVTLAALAMTLLLGLPGLVTADPCEVADAGGTVVLPPVGCDYLSADEVHVIIDGLPPNTTIEFKPIHKDFICGAQPPVPCSEAIPPGLCEGPGGGLGGNVDCFGSTLEFEVRGTGLLDGFNRLLSLPALTEVHTGPRNPGDPVQTFPTEMVALQASLFGDPDFDFLQITAGSANGLPSPGETTLTQQANGNWQVDSFFDITYQIDFQGAPGSVLGGMAGSTTADLQMASNLNPCDVVDNGSGTIDLPPDGCEYLSPDEVHEIIAGLPPNTTIEFAAIHKNFICGNPIGTCSIPLPGGVCEGPGGNLGGNADCFQSDLELQITGTGGLAGFNRQITVQMDTEVHTGPRNPGDPVQTFPNTMFRLQGEIFGDPDFCTLRIRAGDQNGLPSPGHTTLTDNGNNSFAVDSFFDITYEIDYVGCPGSMLEGFGGTSSGTVRMQSGIPVPEKLPGIHGEWLMLFGLILAGGSVAVILRRSAVRT
ncbi:MAG: hypothetical protein JRH19_02975 [Deltaproteobacteria bacterium]|nr:hypothetical protein [Deltaproteobacteria bacterium]